MPKRWTKAEAFGFFGAVQSNTQWSWSGRSPDGKTVVVTLWQDEIIREADQIKYQASLKGPAGPNWMDRPGNRERRDNLLWARDHCGGLFRVVIAKAKDINADPRQIEECFPHKTLVMKLTNLNEETGEFEAISVNNDTDAKKK